MHHGLCSKLLRCGGRCHKVGRSGRSAHEFAARKLIEHRDRKTTHKPEETLLFVGQYEHAIDEKGRVVLPAQYRHQIGERGFVTQLDSCLGLYTEAAFSERAQQWTEALKSKQISLRAYRRLTAKVNEVKVDTAGRVTLPREQLDHFGFGDKAIVAGLVDRIEIWPADQFAYDIENAEADAELAAAIRELAL